MMLIAGILVALAGYWLGVVLGSRRGINIAALLALAISSLGVFYWQIQPYRYLFEAMRQTYVGLMFAMFFLSTGVLVRGLIARALKIVRTSSQVRS